MEEIWDLYNKNKQLVGKTHTRGDDIPEGCYHLVVNAWLKNSKGEYLITRRAANRKSYPLLYECIGGSVLANESSAEGAVRELIEEVGLIFKPTDGKLIKTEVRDYVNGKKFADILDAWLFEYDGEVDLSKATTDEVCSCEWLTVEQIKEIYERGELVPTMEYIIPLHEKLQKDKIKRKNDIKNNCAMSIFIFCILFDKIFMININKEAACQSF